MIVTEVITEQELSERVTELGAAIARDYEDRVPVMVGVLSGSVPFMADLVRAMSIHCETDFLALTRFGEGGRVRIAMDTDINLAGRDVIIVEDIVDTGLTLQVLHRTFEQRNCRSIATATLIDKASRRIVDAPIEYRGFEVGDEFLLGYGLDWNGHYRNVRSIWAVLDFAAFTEQPGVLAEEAWSTRAR